MNFDRKIHDCSKLQKIQLGSDEEHLLAAYKKIASYQVTTDILNVLVRHPNESEPLGKTAVCNAVKRMQHKKITTMGVNQQNDDNGFWKAARFNFCCQILVRLGLWIPEEKGGGEIQDEYCVNPIELNDLKLTFQLNQVGFWDEIHIDVVIGAILQDYLTFAYAEDGTYNVDGVYVEKTKVSIMISKKIGRKNSLNLILIFFLFLFYYYIIGPCQCQVC